MEHRYKDRNGKVITIGDILVTYNDGADGADVWESEENGETIVVDICRHGITCTKWQPDIPELGDDDQSIYNLKYCEIVK